MVDASHNHIKMCIRVDIVMFAVRCLFNISEEVSTVSAF